MQDSFKDDDFQFGEEWVEVSDREGNKTSLRHIATIRHQQNTYCVLGAMDDEDDVPYALMLIREEMTADGMMEHVIVNDGMEIESVVRYFVTTMIREHFPQDMSEMQEEDNADTDINYCCDLHRPGEFCFCGDPDYLQ